MSEITIRRCAIKDAAQLSALACRTFYDTFTGTCTQADMQGFLDHYYNEAQLAQELAAADDHYYFIEVGNIPAGYLRFGETEVPFPYDRTLRALELNRLYIDKRYHGQGIATQLMRFYEDYATANDYRFLWLGVWEHNYRAQAFYRKWGYRFNGHKHPFPIGSTPQTDEWWEKVL